MQTYAQCKAKSNWQTFGDIEIYIDHPHLELLKPKLNRPSSSN